MDPCASFAEGCELLGVLRPRQEPNLEAYLQTARPDKLGPPYVGCVHVGNEEPARGIYVPLGERSDGSPTFIDVTAGWASCGACLAAPPLPEAADVVDPPRPDVACDLCWKGFESAVELTRSVLIIGTTWWRFRACLYCRGQISSRGAGRAEAEDGSCPGCEHIRRWPGRGAP
jgi:hypothetical protein